MISMPFPISIHVCRPRANPKIDMKMQPSQEPNKKTDVIIEIVVTEGSMATPTVISACIQLCPSRARVGMRITFIAPKNESIKRTPPRTSASQPKVMNPIPPAATPWKYSRFP